MKTAKTNKKIILSVIIILAAAVIAGGFTTGYVVKSRVTGAATATCTDTDGGAIPGVKGTITTNTGEFSTTGSWTDYCYTSTGQLIEFYCKNSNTKAGQSTITPTSDEECKDGKIVKKLICTDTDSANSVSIKGHVTGINSDGQTYDYWDRCLPNSDKNMEEYHCVGTALKSIVKDCNTQGKICSDGKCITSGTRSCSASDKCPTGQACINSQCTCPAGYTRGSDNICKKNGKTCTQSGSTVIDTQTFWNGYTWTNYCEANGGDAQKNGYKHIVFYCDSNDNVALSLKYCSASCSPGVCNGAWGVSMSPNGCQDSDNGKNAATPGAVYVDGVWKGTDYCFGKGKVVGGVQRNVNYVKEFYCSNGQATSVDIEAPCPSS